MSGADPTVALDQFFSVIRQQATNDPQFARALCDAIGANVTFNGDAALYAVDPIVEAEQGVESFRTTFLTFAAKDLKKLLKDFGLASAQDMKGKTKVPQLVDLLWERSNNKLRDIKP